MSHGIVPSSAARATRVGLDPLAKQLRGMGVSANAVTIAGVALTLVGAAILATERPALALAVLVVAGLADTLDGAIARAGGGGTPAGAFLDSTADRIADGALFSAAAWLGAVRGEPVLLSAALLALTSSFLVSYVRAKAESLGTRATVGPAPREARLVILIAGIAAWAIAALEPAFVAAVAAVAILATITFLQRIAVVLRTLDARRG